MPDTKSQRSRPPYSGQLFTYHSLTHGEQLTILVEPLMAHLDGQLDLIVRVELNEEFYRQILTCNGIEQDRLAYWISQIKKGHVPDEPPLLLLQWDDGTHTLADGGHRLCAAWRCNLRELLCYLVPESIWRKFLLDVAVPLEALKGDFTEWPPELTNQPIKSKE